MKRTACWIAAIALAAATALPTTASARGAGHPGGHMGAFHGGPAFRAAPVMHSGPVFRSVAGPRIGSSFVGRPFVGRHLHAAFVGRHIRSRGPFIGLTSSYLPYYYDDYDDLDYVPIPVILSSIRIHHCGWMWVNHHRHHRTVRVHIHRCW